MTTTQATTVDIDGHMLPIADCYWIQTAPCGCITALTPTTDEKGRPRTAEQAHERLVPLKRERDADTRRGLMFGLVAKDRYHAETARSWECTTHRKGGTR